MIITPILLIVARYDILKMLFYQAHQCVLELFERSDVFLLSGYAEISTQAPAALKIIRFADV